VFKRYPIRYFFPFVPWFLLYGVHCRVFSDLVIYAGLYDAKTTTVCSLTLICVTPCIFLILVILLPTNAHPLFYFICHFTISPTCFDPSGSSSGHSLHEHLPIFLQHTFKSIFKICFKCVVCLLCCVFHMNWSITLAFRVCLCCPVVTHWQSVSNHRIETCRRDCKVTYKVEQGMCICWQ
jgi:hypothetical protein